MLHARGCALAYLAAAGAIVGIAVGAAGGVALLAGLAALVVVRRRRAARSEAAAARAKPPAGSKGGKSGSSGERQFVGLALRTFPAAVSRSRRPDFARLLTALLPSSCSGAGGDAQGAANIGTQHDSSGPGGAGGAGVGAVAVVDAAGGGAQKAPVQVHGFIYGVSTGRPSLCSCAHMLTPQHRRRECGGSTSMVRAQIIVRLVAPGRRSAFCCRTRSCARRRLSTPGPTCPTTARFQARPSSPCNAPALPRAGGPSTSMQRALPCTSWRARVREFCICLGTPAGPEPTYRAYQMSRGAKPREQDTHAP